MGYEQIKQLCKAVEELFDKFRKGEQTITSGVASYLFKCFDAMQQMVADENFKIDIDQYLADLRKASEGPAAAVGDGDGSSTPAQPQLQVPEAPGAQAQEEAPLLPHHHRRRSSNTSNSLPLPPAPCRRPSGSRCRTSTR
jgi:chemotaxis protein histidine kinase CheA